ncbi:MULTISPECIES: phage holin family protein [Yersinia pseudotuberculosis complex]|uniref:phage holin family protein n=1 Tax=Yersinia pseudotuberculosis complex TaxID=1649845 RepID=UPI00065D0EA5|nr:MULTISPECIES: phage holin family protein [Yersinia pseudotuberculosis complex]CRY71458.1 putative phage-like protein [Yersinia pseudotuberculosis]
MKMPNRDPGSYGLLVWVAIAAMSIYGGLVKYIIDTRMKKTAWSWVAALAQVAVSGFAGLVGGLISIDSGLSIYYVLVVAGMSGTMGSVALAFFWERITGVSTKTIDK